MAIPSLEVETPGGAVAHADEDPNDEAHRRRQRLREKEERLLPHSTVAVAKGHLLIASHRDILERVLTAEGDAAGLATAGDFAAIQAELGKYVPAAAAARGFGREEAAIRPTYELLRQGDMPKSKSLFGQLLNDMLGDGKPGTVRAQKIDGSTLPEFETVRRYFGTTCLGMESTEEGWYVAGAALQSRIGVEEQDPGRATGRGSGGELAATTRRCGHHRRACPLRNRNRVVARAAVADRGRESETGVGRPCRQGKPERRACVQRRNDDVDRRRHVLQAAPPRTQNLAQCGWLSRTSPTLSAKVPPSSNCGS
jgi:hypothetical protein